MFFFGVGARFPPKTSPAKPFPAGKNHRAGAPGPAPRHLNDLKAERGQENEDLNWLGLMNGAFPPETPGGAPLDLRPHLRRSIIEMVLVTDPTKHNVLMEDMKGLVQAGG